MRCHQPRLASAVNARESTGLGKDFWERFGIAILLSIIGAGTSTGDERENAGDAPPGDRGGFPALGERIVARVGNRAPRGRKWSLFRQGVS